MSYLYVGLFLVSVGGYVFLIASKFIVWAILKADPKFTTAYKNMDVQVIQHCVGIISEPVWR